VSRILTIITRAPAAATEPPAPTRVRHRRRRTAALTLLTLALVPAGATTAHASNLAITSPEAGGVINNALPTFTGTKGELVCPPVNPMTVVLQRGNGGESIAIATSQVCLSNEWSATPESALQDGAYTLVAEQREGAETAKSEVSFRVDTTPPQVAITAPPAGSAATATSQAFSGTAGKAEGDTPKVKLAVFAGAGTEPQAYLQTLEQPVVNGTWSATAGGLGPGVYTARAEQTDWAGNVGVSAPLTFRLLAPPVAQLPSASFTWFPSAPVSGQRVSLVSTSLDSASPIVSYAWDVAGNGQFKAAGPVLSTTFATAGNHVVRLRITDARGFSSTATQTIPVTSPPLTVMQPFPIVRIAGTVTPRGVKLSVLAVQTPVGAQVTVSCRGRGCRVKAERRVAAASRRARGASAVLLSFRRFERSLRAGVVLEIRVQRPGEIGKYTRFAIRRRGLPVRLDQCLASTDPRPIVCPA
jgi:PKD domain-containing protein/Big-like domain-containing protein